MPAKWFICQPGWYKASYRAKNFVWQDEKHQIPINDCLKPNGCQMIERCATLPYLRLIGYDRKWNGVSPSAAGTGPRLLYLKATTDYAIDPNDRTFAAFGTSTHEKLSIHQYTHNVLSEEKLSDEQMRGIADVLELDEASNDKYILTDYKTWGSFKVASSLGIVKTQRPMLDINNKPVLLKTGKNKGKPKMLSRYECNPEKADLKEVSLQLNRYRIFFERIGFKISRIQVQAVVRDGNTYIAKSRGIDKNLYIIPIPILPDEEVLNFYNKLQAEVDQAFRDNWVRECNAWESWNGQRCKQYCEVSDSCRQMDLRAREKYVMKKVA